MTLTRVTSDGITDGAIVNADINASAAIAGSKISPNFGSQNLVTNGTGSFSFIQINAIEAKLTFNNLYSESDFSIRNNNGDLQIIDIDNSDRVGFQFGKNGTVTIPQNTDFGAGIDVTGAITGTGDMTIDTNTLHVDSSNNRVGIGTTSPQKLLDVRGEFAISNSNASYWDFDRDDSDGSLKIKDTGTERMRITTAGNVGIGTTVTRAGLAVAIGSNTVPSAGSTDGAAVFGNALGDAAYGLVCGATSSGHGYVQAQRTDGTASTYDLFLQPNGGNVGIGTTSPSTPLHVSTNTDGTSDLLTLHADADGVGANNGIASIKFMGNSNHAAFIKGGHTSFGNTILTFHTDAHDSGINPQERMRIDDSGRVLIGTTNNTPAASNQAGIVFGDNTAGVATVGIASFCADGAAPLLLTRRVSDGNVLGIADDAGTKGLLRVNSNDFEIRSNNNMRFQTGGGNERMRITSDGPHLLLGGTTDVNEITESSANAGLVIGNTSMGNGGLAIINSTSGTGRIYFGDSVGGNAERNRGQINYYHNGDYMIFATAGSERMRINSSGNVGVGTTSPTQKLHVSGDALIAGAAGGTLLLGGSAAHTSKFVIGDNSGSGNGNLVIEGGDGSDFIKINSAGSVGIKTTSPIGTLDVHDGTFVLSKPNSNSSSRNWRFLPDNIAAGNLGLQVSTAAGGSTFQNVLEIDKTGTIFTAQNGTAFSWPSNPGHVWYADGEARSTTANGVHYRINRMNGDGHAVQFYRGQTNMVGFISITSSSTGYGSGSSDERTKKNIEVWNEDVLSKFKTLTPKTFNFNWEEDGTTKHKGYIAQNELDKFPEAYPKNNLSDTGDEFYTFVPTDMTVYLMKGLKEAAEKIETLEAKVAALETK